MKRVGNIFGAVVERDNLRDAFLKASRGKRSRPDQRRYAENLDVEIERLREGLLNVNYPVGGYSRFMIYDPKMPGFGAARAEKYGEAFLAALAEGEKGGELQQEKGGLI